MALILPETRQSPFTPSSCLLSPSGDFLYVEKEAGIALGYNPEELTGNNLRNFLHPEDYKLFKACLERSSQQKFKARLLSNSHQHVWVEVNLTPNQDAEGRVHSLSVHIQPLKSRKSPILFLSGYYRAEENEIETLQRKGELPEVFAAGSNPFIPESIRKSLPPLNFDLEKYKLALNAFSIRQDITERKKAKESLVKNEKLYRSLFENHPDLVLVTDSQGVILKTNNNSLCINLCREDSLTGQNFLHFLSKEGRRKVSSRLPGLLLGHKVQLDTNFQYAATPFMALITFVPFEEEGSITGFFIQIRDNSSRIKQEQEQRLLNDSVSSLSNAPTLALGMQKVLQLFCQFSGFQYAEFWQPLFGQEKVKIKSQWIADESLREFAASSRLFSCEPVQDVLKTIPEGSFLLSGNFNHPSVRSRMPLIGKSKLQSFFFLPFYYRQSFLGYILLFSRSRKELCSFDPEKLPGILSKLGGEIERRKTSEELNKFFTLSPDLFCILGLDGYLKKINPAMQVLFGYSHEEALSLFIMDLVHPNDREKAGQEMAEMLKGNPSQYFEGRFRCKDGSYRWLACTQQLVRNENLTYIIARDVTEQKKAQSELVKLSKAVEESGNEVFILDPATFKFTYANRRGIENLGYSLEELKKITPADVVPELQDVNALTKVLQPLVEGSVKKLLIKSSHIRKNKSQYPIEIHLSLFMHGQSRSVMAQVIDTTERVKAEEALRLSNERYQLASRATRDAVLDWDLSTNMIYLGDGYRTLFGHDLPSSIRVDQWIGYVHPEDSKKVIEALFDRIASNEKCSIEYRYKCADGTYKFILDRAYVIQNDHKRAIRITGAMSDITEQKKNEQLLKEFNAELEAKVYEKTSSLENALRRMKKEIEARAEGDYILQQSLNEKEVLLKEIHHRVKNNMAVISGLLSLQARQTNHPEVKDLFKDSQSRIKSMALIHEHLYQHQNLSRINFKKYLQELVGGIAESFHDYSNEVEVQVMAHDLELDIIHAVPCGLILNELITNSYKYAFQGKQKGIIKVDFSRKEDLFILKVSDNGSGLPTTFNLNTPKTLGLKLVRNLVKQIGGTLEVEHRNGTEFIISFP